MNLYNLILSHVNLTPQKEAIVFNNKSISYEQLNYEVGKIAYKLHLLGLGQGDKILIAFERSSELVVVLLAAIRLGIAFVPIDVNATPQLISSYQENVNCKIAITNSIKFIINSESILKVYSYENIYTSTTKCFLKTVEIASDDLAYLMFTSGTTGKPKGVAISYGNLSHTLLGFAKYFSFLSSDNIFAISAITFDISLFELVMPLLIGGTVTIASEELAHDNILLARYLDSNKSITFMQATPTTWRFLLDANWQNIFNINLISGGEPLQKELAISLLSLAQNVWNIYGPTEATIWATVKKLQLPLNEVSIGKPIPNTICYIVNNNITITNPNEAGELYIGGEGVAIGYWNSNVGEHQDKFSFPKFSENKKVYKTGDLVKYNNDGDIVFVSRIDRQIKFNGHRIELDGIETLLNNHPNVALSAVELIENAGIKSLIAFIELKKKKQPIHMDFSLFFFAEKVHDPKEIYDLYIESAKYADEHGFTAIWTPERHFDEVGAPYPSPSVLSAALSTITKNIALRAGSVVLPLNNPLRVAEEWSIVDNLSQGRVGIAFASGWHPQDFVLAPHNFTNRYQVFTSYLDQFQSFWNGGNVSLPDGSGTLRNVQLFPKPFKKDLDIWITAAGSIETFKLAGRMGANILTHLLVQDIEELAEKINAYKTALKDNQHDVSAKKITVMLHTFIADQQQVDKASVREHLTDYLKSHVKLLNKINGELASEKEEVLILEQTIDRIVNMSSLIGPITKVSILVKKLYEVGVNEIACLLDFGMSKNHIINALENIKKLKSSINDKSIDKPEAIFSEDFKIYLEKHLPSYMLPTEYRVVDSIPLAVSKKINRSDLRKINIGLISKDSHKLPINDRQRILLDILKEVLNKNEMKADDNFFNMGGHSLLATRAVSRIKKLLNIEITLREFFENPSVSLLDNLLVDRTVRNAQSKLIKQPRRPYMPLSFAQKRMYFLYLMDTSSLRYNDVVTYQLDGELNVDALRVAFDLLIERHEILRTAIVIDDVEPKQKILTSVKAVFQYHDLNAGEDLQQKLRQCAVHLFDLTKPPYFTAHVIKKHEREHLLLICIHHIITDGWSMSVFLKELSLLYNAQKNNLVSAIIPLDIQYADYAQFQKIFSETEDYRQQLEYWRNLLSEDLPILSLPTKNIRPAMERFNGARVDFEIDKLTTQKIYELTRKINSTLYTILLAAYFILLARYATQDTVIIGVPIANRNYKETEDMIGCFVNVLPVKLKIDDHDLITKFLQTVHNGLLSAYNNQDVPIEEIVKEVYPDRDLSVQPLIQTMCVLHNTPARDIPMDGIQSHEFNFNLSPTRVDISLGLEEKNGSTSIYFEYNADLFDGDFIYRLSQHYNSIIMNILDNQDEKINNIMLLSKIEMEQLNLFSSRKSKLIATTINEAFSKNVIHYADKPAVIDCAKNLTYRELDQLSNRIASALLQYDILPQDRIVLNLSRKVETIALLIAILKVGAIYISLEDYSSDNLRFKEIISQLKPKLIIVDTLNDFDTSITNTIPLIKLLSGNVENVTAQVKLDNLAYIAFTSGSTGNPKGVTISHASICQLASNNHRLEVSSGQVIAQISSLGFDASLYEIWVSLLNGACVCIINKETLLAPDKLIAICKLHSVKAGFFTTALFQKYCQVKPILFSLFDTVIFGGDKINLHKFTEYLQAPSAKPKNLIHAYGPTEATTFSTLYQVETDKSYDEYLPIGKPLDYTEVYVLDQHQKLQPIYIPGEIYIGGDGVSSGYWHDTELNHKSFIKTDFSKGYLYKTGDIGYWNELGELVFVSRVDTQVKIKGYRIYPSEIEEQINRILGIAQSAVIPIKNANRDTLFAYIEPTSETLVDKSGYLESWHTVYENLYTGLHKNNSDEKYIGWKSSYTSKSIPTEEMDEWVGLTLSRIERLNARRILEIGVGTGLLAKNLLGKCDLYVGLDYSTQVINYLQNTLGKKHENLHLFCLPAQEVKQVPFSDFDLVIINSVSQYFPSIDDMVDIINSVETKLNNNNGQVFIGDIRNYDLIYEFHASVLEKRLSSDTKISEFKRKLEATAKQEYELLISPEFFTQFVSQHIRFKSLELLIKPGKFENEMNCFRFDAILSMKSAKTENDVRWLDWQKSPITIAAVRKRIEKDMPPYIAIKNIFNKKLANSRKIMDSLQIQDPSNSISELCSVEQFNMAVDPHDFLLLCRHLNYEIQTYVSYFPWEYDVILANKNTNEYHSICKAEYSFQGLNISNNPAHVTLTTESIQEKLRQTIPSYMVPTKISIVDKLPLTPTGKIDRNALYQKAIGQENKYLINNLDPSLSPIEATLIRIWKEILKTDSVNLEDNFFELGGDSIISIHMIAKARQESISIRPKQIFRYQTISELAKQVKLIEREPEAEEEDLTGSIPLTPVQHWFFEHDFAEMHHWNQAFLIKLKKYFDFNTLKNAFDQIITRHESLKISYELDNAGQWQQTYSHFKNSLYCERIDLSAYTTDEAIKIIRDYSEKLQASLHLNGGMIKVGIFDMPNGEPPYLAIVIHHLIIDGVSWGILFEDLQHNLSNSTLKLPEKTSSFKRWSNNLTSYAQSRNVKEELSYWSGLIDINPNIPTDHDLGNDTNGNDTNEMMVKIECSFSREVTHKILKIIPKLYKTKINDVLLSAFILALHDWEPKGFLINLDSHGREGLFNNIDVSRTIGWFTAIYPVYLQAINLNLEDNLRRVSSILNEIPNHGIGFGALKYLCTDINIKNILMKIPEAKIGFNYFGQTFQQFFSEESLFSNAKNLVGQYRSARSKIIYLLEVNSYVVDEKFLFEWTYSMSYHNRNTILNLIDRFKFYLEAYAKLCDKIL
jgi:natural product biosynthesis luciferase-like monooxygenase protein/amino acid adenylation domain-containing protein/non-ribosomal peptide synthase protein (TIGR01720 family)